VREIKTQEKDRWEQMQVMRTSTALPRLRKRHRQNKTPKTPRAFCNLGRFKELSKVDKNTDDFERIPNPWRSSDEQYKLAEFLDKDNWVCEDGFTFTDSSTFDPLNREHTLKDPYTKVAPPPNPWLSQFDQDRVDGILNREAWLYGPFTG
jgi:hypothetical protein